MRAAILQLTSSDDPSENVATVSKMLEDAVSQGAEFVLTPEVSNCVSTSRTHQSSVLMLQNDDVFLQASQKEAEALGIWLLIGSLALKTGDADGRFVNRSFLIGPDGKIRAQYDKIHMFDVSIDENETYHESAGYRPGKSAVVAKTEFATIGLSVCYDLRFPKLYQSLTSAGAQILTVPSAFSPVTGAAHWHSLLRARAIETGCYVLAPAQTGLHSSSRGKVRVTYGHSLVVSPWGEVLLDAGTEPGVYMFEINMEKVDDARRRIPALRNARPFDDPI